jgi:hypothetical protein
MLTADQPMRRVWFARQFLTFRRFSLIGSQEKIKLSNRPKKYDSLVAVVIIWTIYLRNNMEKETWFCGKEIEKAWRLFTSGRIGVQRRHLSENDCKAFALFYAEHITELRRIRLLNEYDPQVVKVSLKELFNELRKNLEE